MLTTFKNVRVGVVQATPALFNLTETIEIVCNWIAVGAEKKCDLLLFPESFIPCYPRGLSFDTVIGRRTDRSREIWLDYWKNAIEVSSGQLDKIKSAIKNAKLMVALGVTEKETNGGSLHCSLLYFDCSGNLIGKHRKLKPTGLERLIWGESDGTTLTTIECEFGKIGGLICWENYMPLARMSMYYKGIDIYLAPTADARLTWQATMQHISLEGRCFVLACNQFVRKSDYPERYLSELENEPEIMCAGGSVIYSPSGEVISGPLWNEAGILVAELDFSLLAKSKLDFDCIGHYSRPDVFSLEVNGQPEILKI